MAEILHAWRDGYADSLQAAADFAPDEATQLFDHAIATILDPTQYAVWHVPNIGGRKAV